MDSKLSIFGDALYAMGKDLAERAAAQAREEEECFTKAKTLLSLAQSLGVGKEAHDALFDPGEKMTARKTLWYRRQKRLFGMALDLDIALARNASQKSLAETVYRKRDELKSMEQKQEDALRMFQRTAKGALSAKIDGGTMARTLLKQAGKTFIDN